MFLELRKGNGSIHRSGIAEHVQVALLEINDFSPCGIEDKCVADIPFFRNGPIEDLCSRGNLKELERDVFLKNAEGFAHAIASDAATDGEQLNHQPMHERSAMLELAVNRLPGLG